MTASENAMGTTFRVVCVEDCEDDVALIERELCRGGYRPLVKQVDSPGAMNEVLRVQAWDLVLADWNLPRFSALFALEMIKSKGLDLPLIIVSGSIGEEAAIEAMRAGARDYVMKNGLGRLVPVIQRELREAADRLARKRAEEATAAAEERLRLSTRATNDAIWDWNISTQRLDWSEGFRSLIGLCPHELSLGLESWYDSLHPEEKERVVAARYAVINGGGERWSDQYRFRRADGTYAYVLDRGYVLRNDEGLAVRAIGALTDLTKQKQVEMEISAAYERLRDLTRRLECAKEDERKRVARELHDEFGQLLTGLKLDLTSLGKQLARDATLSRPDLMEKVQRMSTLVNDSIQVVRRVASDLRPSMLDDLGLIPALQWQAREFEARTGVPCETALSQDLAQRELDPERSSALFRIAQELLTNIMRHARASHVCLALREESDGWLLEVCDNGSGIREKDYANPTTLGLRGMQERVALFGGTMKFHGEREKGTTVRVWMPQRSDDAGAFH
jgi:two-component system sensor histidine kinase UhpB